MANKYRACKTVVDGVVFDSKIEARRNGELKLLERAGKIQRLERQVTYHLNVAGAKICKMIVDHTYFEGNVLVLEEVKSKPTKTPVYRLKKKLLLALHPGIDFREYP